MNKRNLTTLVTMKIRRNAELSISNIDNNAESSISKNNTAMSELENNAPVDSSKVVKEASP